LYTAVSRRVWCFAPARWTNIDAEIDRLGAYRALVLCTPEQRASAEDVSKRLGARSAGVYAKAVMHVPIETADDARAVAKELGADCCVAVGGGSTIGLGKAIALTSELPILAVPTTFAGSEMTPIYGITAQGQKKTGRDSRVLPKTVIYDPLLTLTLPGEDCRPERHECHRPLRGSAVRAGCESDHLADGGRGHPHAGIEPSARGVRT
jgi:maleylacetate reductase